MAYYSIYLRIKHKSIQGGRKGLASSVFIAAIMYVLVAIFTVSSTKIKWKKITIESQLGTCSVEWSVVHPCGAAVRSHCGVEWSGLECSGVEWLG